MALASELSPGWIECEGNACPVRPGARVQVQFRHDRSREAAERLSTPHGNFASSYQGWVHTGAGTDVVAYRVVQP